MSLGYQNKNVSSTVDVFTQGNLAIAGPVNTIETCIGNSKIYAVNANDYAIKNMIKITGASPVTDLKVRALVNGSLAKEVTYTTDGLKDDFAFNAPAEAEITLEYSSNSVTTPVLVECARLIIQAGALKELPCSY